MTNSFCCYWGVILTSETKTNSSFSSTIIGRIKVIDECNEDK